MHSLDALSGVVIFDCMCMVCMVETSSDGRERVYVMFVCQGACSGNRSGEPSAGAGTVYNLELVFAIPVYRNVEGKGLRK